MLNLRFVGSGKVASREVPAPAIDARHAGPSGLATRHDDGADAAR